MPTCPSFFVVFLLEIREIKNLYLYLNLYLNLYLYLLIFRLAVCLAVCLANGLSFDYLLVIFWFQLGYSQSLAEASCRLAENKTPPWKMWRGNINKEALYLSHVL